MSPEEMKEGLEGILKMLPAEDASQDEAIAEAVSQLVFAEIEQLYKPEEGPAPKMEVVRTLLNVLNNKRHLDFLVAVAQKSLTKLENL